MGKSIAIPAGTIKSLSDSIKRSEALGQEKAMATVDVQKNQSEAAEREESCSSKGAMVKQGEGLRQYYLQHIHDLQLQVRQKTHNLNRLEAQRNELNSKGPNFLSLPLFFFLIFFSTPQNFCTLIRTI